MRRTTTAMAGAALAFLACSRTDFNTPTLLNKVRILGIQAEPPQPALGESTTLRALVYQPPPADGGATSVTGYSWSWCPLPMSSTDPSQCPIDQPAADQLFAGISGVPQLDLGTGDTATFTNPFPAALLAPLCAGNLNQIPALAAAAAKMGSLAASGALSFPCTIAGFPITVKLVVHTIAGDLPAVFSVYLRITDDPNISSNKNPNLGSIFLDGSASPLGEMSTQTIARNSSVQATIDGLTLADSELLPDPNEVLPDPNNPQPQPNDKNPYLKPNDTPYERLTVAWFAECGDFGGDGQGGATTGYLGKNPDDPISPFSAALLNTWNIPKIDDYASTAARIIVVVNDSRGGVNWTTGVVRLDVNGSGADGGPADLPTADAEDATALPDVEPIDLPTEDATEPSPDAESMDVQQADVDQLIADAASLDAAEIEIVDAAQESTP